MLQAECNKTPKDLEEFLEVIKGNNQSYLGKQAHHIKNARRLENSDIRDICRKLNIPYANKVSMFERFGWKMLDDPMLFD